MKTNSSSHKLIIILIPAIREKNPRFCANVIKSFMGFLLVLGSVFSFGQEIKISLDDAIKQALQNNPGVQAALYSVEYQKEWKKTSTEIPKMDVTLQYGQYNSVAKNDNNVSIGQTIPFPTVFTSLSALNRSLVAGSEIRKVVTENELILQVKQVYYELVFLEERNHLLIQQDSIYDGFVKSASLRFQTGESTLLEKATALTQSNEIKNMIRQNEADRTIFGSQLQTLLNNKQIVKPNQQKLEAIPFQLSGDSMGLSSNPSLAFFRQQIEITHQQKKLEVAKALPDIKVGYFNQTLIGYQTINGQEQYFGKGDRFQGVFAGISVPIWFGPHTSRIKALSYAKQSAEANYELHTITLQGQLQQAWQRFIKSKNSLTYYTSSALPNAELILQQSSKLYKGGEIGFADYLIGLRNALGIKEAYLQNLLEYNQSIINIEFLTGQKN